MSDCGFTRIRESVKVKAGEENNRMAAANTSPSEEDCTCPVCCDIFKDPVLLLCGHSFCQLCLQEWWRQSGLKTCPVCKEMFMMSQPPRNLALRNLSDALRRERRANSGSKEICSLHAPVTLDPNTGDCMLTISENMTRSTAWYKYLPLLENPERLRDSGVLGSEGFNSGKHSWDVEVGCYWAVGVAAKTKDREIWGINLIICTDILRELTPEDDSKTLSEDSLPQKVRVQLDYDRGLLSFFDLDRKTPVHTIRHTFTETVFPYFRENTKILPAELSVKTRQPK